MMPCPPTPKPRSWGLTLAATALTLAALAMIWLVILGVRAYSNQDPAMTEQLPLLLPHESLPIGPLQAGTQFDAFLLEKGKRLLTAYAKGKEVRRYRVSLGRTPEGAKEVQGDGKTPEGLYYLDAKNPNSSYYKNLNISYPNAQDKQHAASLGQSPGGDIKIHGLAPSFASIGFLHLATDWTEGCVAVTNEEMEELYTRTILDSPITITP